MESVGYEFFAGDTVEVARNLLGMTLAYQDCSGIIVETEAYKDDAASHAVTRPKKGRMLRDTYGRVYIYFIYGMYHCLNFTTEKNGVGAVLIRAIEPVSGLNKMLSRRGEMPLRRLANGPGKLFIAMGLTPEHHGEHVGETVCIFRSSNTCHEISVGPRIGISKAKDLPWRFFISNSDFVSR